ncbi:MAG: hypothetical protein ACTSWW_10610 [Promethearchaeota archaeon]
MTKLPKKLFCSNCGTLLEKNLMDSLIVGKTAFCEHCGQKFVLNFTSIEHDPAEIKPETKRKTINWQKTGVDLEQNMKKLGKNLQKVSKKVGKQVRKGIKSAQKAKDQMVKEGEKIGKQIKKFMDKDEEAQKD